MFAQIPEGVAQATHDGPEECIAYATFLLDSAHMQALKMWPDRPDLAEAVARLRGPLRDFCEYANINYG